MNNIISKIEKYKKIKDKENHFRDISKEIAKDILKTLIGNKVMIHNKDLNSYFEGNLCYEDHGIYVVGKYVFNHNMVNNIILGNFGGNIIPTIII